MFFCLFLFLKWNEEKDRKSCSGSCRGTNLKQLEHEIEFSQSSVASRHTPQKLTETKTVCICGVMQSFLSWPPPTVQSSNLDELDMLEALFSRARRKRAPDNRLQKFANVIYCYQFERSKNKQT